MNLINVTFLMLSDATNSRFLWLCRQKVSRFYFQHTVGTRICMPNTWLDAQDFFVRLPAAGMMYPQGCFGQTVGYCQVMFCVT